jgi:hypothetical protein
MKVGVKSTVFRDVAPCFMADTYKHRNTSDHEDGSIRFLKSTIYQEQSSMLEKCISECGAVFPSQGSVERHGTNK